MGFGAIQHDPIYKYTVMQRPHRAVAHCRQFGLKVLALISEESFCHLIVHIQS